MNFILTRYIYPISESIQISERLNFELDNSRTKEEIELVLAHIEKSYNSPDEVYEYETYFRLPIHDREETEDLVTIESAINDFRDNYSEHDEYLKAFFKENKESAPLEKLAKMWVIARFDDEGEYEKLKKQAEEMRESGDLGFFMLGEDHPIVDNSKKLVSYCFLLSLLIHTDDELYNGESFLLHHEEHEINIPKVDRFLNQTVLYFVFGAHSIEIKEEDKWKSFFHIRDEIIRTSNSLDSIFDDSNEDKLLYIANLLKVVGHDINDERYRLVTLVSIIELLLTHSPDYRRFNVEDSISKQFRLKTITLIYKYDKTIELDWIKKRLKEVYNQRSNIAHGSFKKLDKYLRKKVNQSNENDISKTIILERLTNDVYFFIKAIIEEYINDREFVEFLKEN